MLWDNVPAGSATKAVARLRPGIGIGSVDGIAYKSNVTAFRETYPLPKVSWRKESSHQMIMASDGGGMNNRGLEKLIREIGADVEGSPGFWEFTAHGKRLYCISDESQDRLRVMTSVADASKLAPEVLVVCMEANFDRALDARYCLHDNVLWAAFMHPLRSLRPRLFRSACSQVAKLSENFGTSYSSGKLRFGGS